MKKQIIRLTESDLHRIIRESVKRVIRESEIDAEAERLRQAWINARRSGNVQAMLDAKKAYTDYTGQHPEVLKLQQGVDSRPMIDAENEKRNITPFDKKKHAGWYNDILAKRAAARETDDALGPQINPELGIDLTN